MAYQVLARKLRPKRFQDVVGQSHITRSLQNAILRNQLGHAYLFTGTRGIGKTSVARVFAKALRCEQRLEDANPCGACPSCLDFETGSSMNVLEIDGASNNSVDNIRELIGNVQYLPTSGKYKIYIIDEVHMLSASAFNALLKTLEEPPEHVIFIFATTEPHKLLGTVLSRCQRFDFRNASLPDLMGHLQNVAAQEGISFENEHVLRQVCQQGRGSFRDTLSLLDQILSFSPDGKVTEEVLVYSLGLARTSAVQKIAAELLAGDIEGLRQSYRGIMAENVALESLLSALLDQLFEIIEKIDDPNILYKKRVLPEGLLQDISSAEILWIYESLAKDTTWILDSLSPEKVTEIALQKLCLRRQFLGKDPVEKSSLKATAVNPVEKKVAPAAEPVKQEAPENVERPEKKTTEKPAELIKPSQDTEKSWDGFLSFLRSVSPASASNLEQGNVVGTCQLGPSDVKLELGFKKSAKVFYDHVEEADIRQRIVENLAKYSGVEVEKVFLELTLLDDKEVGQSFKSKAELLRQKEEEELARKRNELLNDPIIKEAEKIFNSKVDKVILNKQES